MKPPYSVTLARSQMRRLLAQLTRQSAELRTCYRKKHFEAAIARTLTMTATTRCMVDVLETLAQDALSKTNPDTAEEVVTLGVKLLRENPEPGDPL